MKNKKFVYKNCKGAVSKRNQRQLKIRKWLGGLLLLAIASAGYFGWAMEFPTFVSAEVSIPKVGKGDMSNKEIAVDYLKGRGFTDEQVFNFTCLMHYENGSYSEYATFGNKNQTVDRGFLMHNSKTPPYKISDECAFSMMCSLEKFADYILGGGDWNRWLAFRDKCK